MVGETTAVKDPTPPHCPVDELGDIDLLGAPGVPVFPPEDVPPCKRAEGETSEEMEAAVMIDNDEIEDVLPVGEEESVINEVCEETPHKLAVDKGVEVLEEEPLPREDLEGEEE